MRFDQGPSPARSMLFDALQEFPLRFPLPKHPLLKALIGSGPFHHFFANVASRTYHPPVVCFPFDSFLGDNKCWRNERERRRLGGVCAWYKARDPLAPRNTKEVQSCWKESHCGKCERKWYWEKFEGSTLEAKTKIGIWACSWNRWLEAIGWSACKNKLEKNIFFHLR